MNNAMSANHVDPEAREGADVSVTESDSPRMTYPQRLEAATMKAGLVQRDVQRFRIAGIFLAVVSSVIASLLFS
jgi:hypothetical protein